MVTILTQQNLQPEDPQVVAKLDHQLNPNRTPLAITEVLNSDTTYVFVYREQQQIVGMATLTCYRVISGYKGWIEDVVVDTAQRGKGIGKQLTQAILEKAKLLQLQKLLLYTEDEKQAAIHLYEQLGFTKKNSRIYFLDL
ncbi:MAG: GNAT family N-acetyltransferase [Cyclobacteriaceae bacterium]